MFILYNLIIYVNSRDYSFQKIDIEKSENKREIFTQQKW